MEMLAGLQPSLTVPNMNTISTGRGAGWSLLEGELRKLVLVMGSNPPYRGNASTTPPSTGMVAPVVGV